MKWFDKLPKKMQNEIVAYIDMQQKIDKLKPGSKLYVHSSLYISHGEDDIAGGIATVKEIEHNQKLTDDNNSNDYMVIFEEIPSSAYNLRGLLEKQSELKKRYGKQKAHPDPDPVSEPWDNI